MNQRIIDELSQAIHKAMPRNATSDQKATVDLAARDVFEKHFGRYLSETAELDQVNARLHEQIAELEAENEQLRGEITALLTGDHPACR